MALTSHVGYYPSPPPQEWKNITFSERRKEKCRRFVRDAVWNSTAWTKSKIQDSLFCTTYIFTTKSTAIKKRMVKKEELCDRRKREQCVMTTAVDSFEMVTTPWDTEREIETNTYIDQQTFWTNWTRMRSEAFKRQDYCWPARSNIRNYSLVCPRLSRSLSLTAWNRLVTCFLVWLK